LNDNNGDFASSTTTIMVCDDRPVVEQWKNLCVLQRNSNEGIVAFYNETGVRKWKREKIVVARAKKKNSSAISF